MSETHEIAVIAYNRAETFASRPMDRHIFAEEVVVSNLEKR